MMRKIKIVIERSSDLYAAYAPDVTGVAGMGDTVAEAKASLLEAIEIIKGFKDVPKELTEPFELVYRYDVASLLNYYKGVFTNSALEKITGINQRQLQHYSSGLKKPRPEQRKKIENGLHRLADELSALEL